MRQRLTMLMVVIVLLAIAVPALAQETALQSNPQPSGVDLVGAAGNLFTLVYNLTYLPFAAAFVFILVAVTKRIPRLNVSASTLTLVYTVLIWALWVGVNQLGYGDVFQNVIKGLTFIGGALLGIAVTPAGAQVLYDQANKRGVALLGYQRTAPDIPDPPLVPEPIAEVA